MKRLFFYFLSAIAVLSGCEKAEDAGLYNQDNTIVSGDASSTTLPEVLYATVADDDSVAQTRTYVDGTSVKWHSGESISYYAGTYGNVKYTMEEGQPDGTVSAEFEKDGDANYAFGANGAYSKIPDYPLAIYPYDETQTATFSEGGYGIQVKFAQEQTYAPNSFGKGANIMVATGSSSDDDKLKFQHACGYLVIKLYGTDTRVSNITLTALGDGVKLSGEATLRVKQNNPVAFKQFADAAYNTVTLDCSNGGEGVALSTDAANPTEFWFALPPVTITDGFEITVTDTDGYTFTKKTIKDVEITRREIQPMAALEFIPNLELTPNRFFYTRSDGKIELVKFHDDVKGQPFVASYSDWGDLVDAKITKHYYAEKIGKFVIECDAPIIGIKDKAFTTIALVMTEFPVLSSISLPSQLRTIGEYAFYANPITELVIPGNVTLIKNYAFRSISKLQRVTFLWGEEMLQVRDKDGLAVSGDDSGPFNEAKLEYIYVDRNIEYRDDNGEKNDVIDIDTGFFSNGKDHVPAVVEIGSNMSTIPESMFAGVSIANLVIPGNITSIGKNNFYNSQELEEVTFLPSPTDTPLTMGGTHNIGDTGPFYIPNSLFDNLKTIRLNREINYILEGIDSPNEGIFSQRAVLETLELGPQVKTISDYMFAGTQVLTSVTIPSSVTTIGNYAFYDCDEFTSVNVPSSVTTIGLGAFYDCDGLTSATINSSTLGSNMFDGCGNLATVTIGGTLDAINVDAFTGCSKLSTLNISGSVGSIGDHAFDTFPLTSLNISGHVGTIGTQAFNDNDYMTSFTVTGSVGTIGASAFEDSDALATVNITGTVNKVCSYAFSDCDAVTTLAIRANTVEAYAYEDMDGLKTATLYGATVGDGVLRYCDNLEELIIDGGVNSIGNDAFYDCPSLASVTFKGSTTNLRLGYQPGTNDTGPFYGSPLTYINLNRQIDYIYDDLDATDEGVFVNANTTTPATVVFGANVRAIHNWMFYGVPVSELTIPAGIDAIGKEAFGNNSHLTKVTCEGSTPAALDSWPFTTTNLQGIYVPSGSVDLYKANWLLYQWCIQGK